MEILFEDSELLVCIKPAGLISQADSEGGQSMISLLEHHTGGKVYPVHRLDRETGGVMVYAKTRLAAAELCRQVADRNFQKEYLALVCGLTEPEGQMDDWLFRDSAKNKSYVVRRERRGVKKASLSYRLLGVVSADNRDYSLVSVVLHTGRTHQIRVQFAHRKMPLRGDKKYGAKCGDALGLWSYRISFQHPKTGEERSFTAPFETIANPTFREVIISCLK